MNYLQNLHTHTIYDDGRDTPEALTQTAIEKGFDSIGFSGHAHYARYSMSKSGTMEYKQEISRLKEKYAGIIDIFCGLEMEMVSDNDLSDYDFVIGSVHYLTCGETAVAFDRSAGEVRQLIDTYFNGNGMAYAEAYYKTLAQLPQYGNFDIIGHFDLITKHADQVEFFDMDSSAYLHAATEAAEALAGKIPYFEINTGAMARGYRMTPYPSVPLIKELKRLGFGAVISSDCHSRDQLDFAFDQAAHLLRSCGFEVHYVLTKQGFKAIPL